MQRSDIRVISLPPGEPYSTTITTELQPQPTSSVDSVLQPKSVQLKITVIDETTGKGGEGISIRCFQQQQPLLSSSKWREIGAGTTNTSGIVSYEIPDSFTSPSHLVRIVADMRPYWKWQNRNSSIQPVYDKVDTILELKRDKGEKKAKMDICLLITPHRYSVNMSLGNRRMKSKL